MIKEKINKKFLTQQILFSKYVNSKEELNKQYIDSLIKNKKCHYCTMFKDYLIYDFIDEFIKKYYSNKESIIKLPKISIYYYHYLKFFCRPFFKNYYYNILIQNYFDRKAEIFYKEKYENKNNNFNIIKKNDKELIIFDNKTRKLLESSIIQTTIDLNSNINDINLLDENNKKREENFFTIKTQNDILLDILNNLTNNQNNNKKKEEEKIKQNKNNTNKKNSSEKKKNNIELNFIRNGKIGLFNLYKKCKVTSDRNNNNLGFLSSGNSNSPNFSSKSNLIHFKKCKPQFNIHKNSFILNSNMTSYIKIHNNKNNNNNKSQHSKINNYKGNINNYTKINLDKKKNKKIQTKSFSSHYHRNKNNDINKEFSTSLLLTYLNSFNKSRSRSIKNKKKKKDSLDIKNSSNINIFSVRSNIQYNKLNKSINMNYNNNNFRKEKKNKVKHKKIKANKSLDTIVKNINFHNESNNKENNINSNEKKSVNLNVNVNLNNIHININTNALTSSLSFNRNKNNNLNIKKKNKSNERNKIINKEMEKFVYKIKEINQNKINDILINQNKVNNDLFYHYENFTPSGFNFNNSKNKREIYYKSNKKNIKNLKSKNKKNVFSSRDSSINKCKNIFNSSK